MAVGAERFRWDRVIFESNRGCRLRPEDLGGYLANRARTENLTLLVQPALSNHPDLRSGPNEALATARLVTGRSIHGEVTPIFCYILFGLAERNNSPQQSCHAGRRGEWPTYADASARQSCLSVPSIWYQTTPAYCPIGMPRCAASKLRTTHASTLSLLAGMWPSLRTGR